MKITWVTRSFLDYRIPVYAALDKLCGHQLTVIYNQEVIPQRVSDKIKALLGERAIGMVGEICIGGKKQDNATMANNGFRIPVQRGLVSAIMKSNPEVMVSDGFFQWTYASLFIRCLSKIPHVMCYERTEHTERYAGKFRTWYRKFAMHWIDAIDCNGSLTAEYVCRLGYTPNKLTFGHMTADTSGLADSIRSIEQRQVDSLRKRYGCKETVFLYIGQIIPRKGVKEMLNAWKEAHLQDATLIMVGSGSQYDEIAEMIIHEDINDAILAGIIDYNQIASYYSMADCFIIPTLEDNWSLVVPEAMACGLPILCSIYNGCWPELVRKENGWTFDPVNNQSFVKAFHTSYAHKNDLKKMGKQSFTIVRNYTPEIAAKGILDACLIAKNELV